MKQKKVAIIISACSQGELLDKCLYSIKEKTYYKEYKIFFIDDSGTGNLSKRVKKNFKKIETIVTSGYTGFSVAFNKGIKMALKNYNPDYILLLNDDTKMIQKNWLEEMIKVGESDKRIGILGCQLIYPNRSLQNVGGHISGWAITQISKFKKGEILDVDHIMGAFFLIKREVIDKIGLLDEIYNPYLLEETDYCLRAKKKGFLIKTVTSIKVIHEKSHSINAIEDKGKLFVRFKNDIVFSTRHLSTKNALFRIFVYLPILAVLEKKKDTDKLKLENFKLRKHFLRNLCSLTLAFGVSLKNLNKIKGSSLEK